MILASCRYLKSATSSRGYSSATICQLIIAAMKYSSGELVKVGDKVKLWEGCYGVVVCSIDTGEYTPDFPEEGWSYLKSGVMIDSDKGGLIHYIESDEDLELLARAER